MRPSGGRPSGSRTKNRTPGARSGPPVGHRQPRSPNLGAPVRRNPWEGQPVTPPQQQQQVQQQQPAVPATVEPAPRQASGRFGRKPRESEDGCVQRIFRDQVKAEIGKLFDRKGHGKKHGVTGSLPRGSPWFFPNDLQQGTVPDRNVHLMNPIYLVCWEFYDSDILAPPCAYCGSSKNVRVVFAIFFIFFIFFMFFCLVVASHNICVQQQIQQ